MREREREERKRRKENEREREGNMKKNDDLSEKKYCHL